MADYGFHVLKGARKTEEDVFVENGSKRSGMGIRSQVALATPYLLLSRPNWVWQRGMFQMVFEKCQLQSEGFGGWNMRLARRQEGAISVAEHRINGDQVIERLPIFQWILNAAGDEHGA